MGSRRQSQPGDSGGGSSPRTGPAGEPISRHLSRSVSWGWRRTSVGLFSRACPSPAASAALRHSASGRAAAQAATTASSSARRATRSLLVA